MITYKYFFVCFYTYFSLVLCSLKKGEPREEILSYHNLKKLIDIEKFYVIKGSRGYVVS